MLLLSTYQARHALTHVDIQREREFTHIEYIKHELTHVGVFCLVQVGVSKFVWEKSNFLTLLSWRLDL